ncbi:hypothetical protein AB1Y20_013466 [Prymnesium parvum]|uniref:Uncharacterized protein n=1 Tax=Prymnesium parvum TaxID=97485 RepID=A0AB34IFY3_PRYPA
MRALAVVASTSSQLGRCMRGLRLFVDDGRAGSRKQKSSTLSSIAGRSRSIGQFLAAHFARSRAASTLCACGPELRGVDDSSGVGATDGVAGGGAQCVLSGWAEAGSPGWQRTWGERPCGMPREEEEPVEKRCH